MSVGPRDAAAVDAGPQRADVPSGVVTLLLTDVEASTRLWQVAPRAMASAVARYEELVRGVVRSRGGVTIKSKGEGDATFNVFARASDALAAAADLAESFAREPWPPDAALGTRIALHTGEVEERAGDLYGPVVNRCARLRSIARGGQVLLSEATHALVVDEPGYRIRDLGTVTLRDLDRHERVYGLVVGDEGADPFPEGSIGPVPNNLPGVLTSFVGRRKELDDLRALLGSHRLVTLSGPGGSGKTRLALAAANELVGVFPDGGWWVELASVGSSELVAQAIASALGVREAAGRGSGAAIAGYLQDKRTLLVLDNFEHVIDAAPLVSELLAAAAGVTVLATSREVLRLRGEREMGLEPLPVPPPGGATDVEELAGWDSVQLFVERARAAVPGFAITRDNAAAVLEIVEQLDGLPLAIELAAARLRVLPPGSLAARLGSRLRLLTGGSRDLPERQRTLRGAIEWSYDLLSEPERAFLDSLSVFSGPADLEAVEAVCAEGTDALGYLTSLVEKSLVRRLDTDADGPLFALLETIKEFGRERLRARGEAERFAERHAEHYLRLAQEAEGEIIGPLQIHWLDRLERDHDNLQEAIRWSLERGAIERAACIGAALHWFWWIRGQLSTGRHWLGRALAHRGARPAVRGRALVAHARLSADQGDYDEARRDLDEALAIAAGLDDEELRAHGLSELSYIGFRRGSQEGEELAHQALEIFRRRGDRHGEAIGLMRLASLATRRGDYERAAVLHLEALEIRRALGDTWGTASALNNLGYDAALHGRFDEAGPYLEECLELFEKVGFKEGIANATDSLALVAAGRGDWPEAIACYERALALFREMGYLPGVCFELVHLGRTLAEAGDLERARRCLREGLELAHRIGDEETQAFAYEGVASYLMRLDRAEEAAALFAAAHRFREEVQIPLPPVDRARMETAQARVAAALGEQGFGYAWRRGLALSRADTHARAVTHLGGPAPPLSTAR